MDRPRPHNSISPVNLFLALSFSLSHTFNYYEKNKNQTKSKRGLYGIMHRTDFLCKLLISFFNFPFFFLSVSGFILMEFRRCLMF